MQLLFRCSDNYLNHRCLNDRERGRGCDTGLRQLCGPTHTKHKTLETNRRNKIQFICREYSEQTIEFDCEVQTNAFQVMVISFSSHLIIFILIIFIVIER